MQITWYGQSCFQIAASPKNGDKINIVIDPFDEKTGLKIPSLEANILLVTHDHPDHNNVKAVKGSYFLIEGPGEYEVKNVFIKGINSYHDSSKGSERGLNTIYTIETEDIKICHLGDLGQELSDEQIEKIGVVDILMVPVGGVYTIDSAKAVKIMSEIEPKIIIPMHYQIPKLKFKLEGLEKFLKTLGIKSVEPQPKLSIKKKEIPEDEVKVIVLNN